MDGDGGIFEGSVEPMWTVADSSIVVCPVHDQNFFARSLFFSGMCVCVCVCVGGGGIGLSSCLDR